MNPSPVGEEHRPRSTATDLRGPLEVLLTFVTVVALVAEAVAWRRAAVGAAGVQPSQRKGSVEADRFYEALFSTIKPSLLAGAGLAAWSAMCLHRARSRGARVWRPAVVPLVWFVPLVNLVAPVVLLDQLYRSSGPWLNRPIGVDHEDESGSWLVWGPALFCIGGAIAGAVALFEFATVALEQSDHDGYAGSVGGVAGPYLVGSALAAAGAAVTVVLVLRICAGSLASDRRSREA